MIAPPADWYYRDNRFRSVAHQERVHGPIAELAVHTLGERGGSVLDLGCGNGALLQAVREACSAAIPYGIERVPQSIEHARQLQPEFAGHFFVGDLLDAPTLLDDALRFAIVGLNPSRLIEAPSDRAERLKVWLRDHADHVLIYAYGHGLTDHGGLVGFARLAGIELADPRPEIRASLALRF